MSNENEKAALNEGQVKEQEAQPDVADLQRELAEAKAQNRAKDEALAQLNGELAKSQENSDTRPVFKCNKKKYVLVVAKSTYKGEVVDAAALRENQELLAELVEMKSGILVPEKDL